jgi:hypothetical protein
MSILVTLRGQRSHVFSREFIVDDNWARIGHVIALEQHDLLTATIEWNASPLECWGLTLDYLVGAEQLIPEHVSVQEMGSQHLIPETFYFKHDAALDLEVVSADSTVFEDRAGGEIATKKCSYCGRWLPIDTARPGSLSFHRHTSKATGHQNECRACKKWRINDAFNPLRTVDQLHESSVITRERKILLREPEILRRLKERSGDGLKSQVWRRFGKCCFNCGNELDLGDVRLDHTRPLAYLWPLDEYATCLCESCNGTKRDKFPVDFYSSEKLTELSEICGLSIEALRMRSVNEAQLHAIRQDLARFAREWDPRLFAATARRVEEVEPDVWLFEELQQQDRGTYDWLIARLQERPGPIGDGASGSS